jgi:hypothetical protein
VELLEREFTSGKFLVRRHLRTRPAGSGKATQECEPQYGVDGPLADSRFTAERTDVQLFWVLRCAATSFLTSSTVDFVPWLKG